MTIATTTNPDHRSAKLWVATLLGAVALFAGGQAVAPTPAVAMDGDETEDVCTLEGEPDIDISWDPLVCEGDEGEGGDGSGDGGTSEPPSDGGVSDAPSDGNEEVIVIWEPKYPGRPEPNPAPRGTPADGKTGSGKPVLGQRPPKKDNGSWPPPRVKTRADSLPRPCRKAYLEIQKWHWENDKLQTGRWGILKFFLERYPVPTHVKNAAELTWKDSCLKYGPVPADET